MSVSPSSIVAIIICSSRCCIKSPQPACPPAWVIWIFVHILLLIGFRNRFVVLFEWAWAYVTLQRSSRLITGEREN